MAQNAEKTIEERIREVLATEFPDSWVAPVSDVEHLGDKLAMDSLDHVELCIFLEDEFGVLIPDEDWDNVKSISEAAALIKKLKS